MNEKQSLEEALQNREMEQNTLRDELLHFRERIPQYLFHHLHYLRTPILPYNLAQVIYRFFLFSLIFSCLLSYIHCLPSLHVVYGSLVAEEGLSCESARVSALQREKDALERRTLDLGE